MKLMCAVHAVCVLHHSLTLFLDSCVGWKYFEILNNC